MAVEFAVCWVGFITRILVTVVFVVVGVLVGAEAGTRGLGAEAETVTLEMQVRDGVEEEGDRRSLVTSPRCEILTAAAMVVVEEVGPAIPGSEVMSTESREKRLRRAILRNEMS